MYRIAFCIRPGFESGGDGVQLVKTKQYVESLFQDTRIEIITEPDNLTNEYDIAHIFNYATYSIVAAFFERAKALKIKIVSSTIFWDYSYSIMPLPMIVGINHRFIREWYVQAFRAINPLLYYLPFKKFRSAYYLVSRDFAKRCNQFINDSDLILPNSKEEGMLCCRFAGTQDCEYKIRVVYNGVDINNVDIIPEDVFFTRFKIPRNYILQVGRIEYAKNQLNLITALKDNPEIPIVILGSDSHSRTYPKMVKKVAKERGNVFFVSNVPHSVVYSFYKYAKVHVLLSLRESPGLVSLEALSQGCPIVVSDSRFLPLDTYFKMHCVSVNPFDKEAIVQAITKQMNAPRCVVPLSEFEWSVAAQQTYSAYKELLEDE